MSLKPMKLTMHMLSLSNGSVEWMFSLTMLVSANNRLARVVDRLRSLIALPNNIYAGISGNQLCLSAQGAPHAWPGSAAPGQVTEAGMEKALPRHVVNRRWCGCKGRAWGPAVAFAVRSGRFEAGRRGQQPGRWVWADEWKMLMSASLPTRRRDGSRKWHMPPMRLSGCHSVIATQEPSSVRSERTP